ncbi:MAG: hypothetical protein Tsb002_38180 [Wenzhouxiangellaceae bacterium]
MAVTINKEDGLFQGRKINALNRPYYIVGTEPPTPSHPHKPTAQIMDDKETAGTPGHRPGCLSMQSAVYAAHDVDLQQPWPLRQSSATSQ